MMQRGRSGINRRAVIGAMLGLALVACRAEEPSVSTEVQSFPTSEATNARTVFLTGSVVTTTIESARIIQFAERDSAWAYQLTVNFFDETGAHTSVMTADSALVRETARFLEVYGAVDITTDDGRTLVTDRLAWDDEARRIHTESYVEITEGDDLMTGYGFDSNPELTDIKLRKVTGRLADPKVLDTL
ncbi:MAG TPA: LPS export ABC transporter periplasmic protein LptC [Acidobacteriota bacterium]|nr:LPS export ABC transporter periplasmic protein LptC [Acidobacteriota bacterium]